MTFYSFENLNPNDVFFVTQNHIKYVFKPAELPIDEKYRTLLVFWLERFLINVSVNSNVETINKNKTVFFTTTDVAQLLHVSIEDAIKITKSTFELFEKTGLEWKSTHFSLIQDTVLWINSNDSNKQCEVTFGEVFATLLPKMCSVWLPKD